MAQMYGGFFKGISKKIEGVIFPVVNTFYFVTLFPILISFTVAHYICFIRPCYLQSYDTVFEIKYFCVMHMIIKWYEKRWIEDVFAGNKKKTAQKVSNVCD